MTTYRLPLVIALAAAVIPSRASAHDAQTPASAQAPNSDVGQCLRVQPAVQNIVTGATARAEAARLSNSPSDLRAAVEHLEAALRDIRAQLSPCATAATSTDPHATHPVPSTSPPAATTAAPAPPKPPDPHVGHKIPPAAPAKRATGAKPTTSKPKTSKSSDLHGAHSPAVSGGKQMDPVNGLMVDPATAPATTYQGQTYYFSSEQSRKEFLANPAKFAKKAKK